MNLYKVDKLSEVKISHYKEGDFFMTKRSLGIIMNGKIETIPLNLSNYVTKNELSKQLKDVNKDE